MSAPTDAPRGGPGGPDGLAPDGRAPDDAHPWAALAPAHALGALDADERVAFEAHLAGCAACGADVRAYQEVAALLAHAAPAAAPPPALRARVLAAATGPQLAPDDVVPIAAARGGSRTAARTAAREAGWGGRAPWMAAAASVALAAGLGAAWARERGARAEAERALAARDQSAGAAVAAAGAAAAGRDSLAALVAALTEPDVRTARLAATGEAAAMRLTWSRRRGVVVLTASGLPPAAAGRTYQLWGIPAAGAPQSLGTFAPDPGGQVRVVLRVPAGAAAMAVAAVTEEPAGGSPRPTSAPLMAGTIGAE